jgi:hypothetical protein
MAKTIMELFKDRKKELYTSSGPLGGISSKVLIESRGLINPPRQAALLLASPNAIGDLIGSAGGALLGGNANRPSDTIFKNNSLLSKPISVIPTVAQLRNAIEPNKNYFVKTEPSPGANIANFIKNAIKSPAAAQSAGLQIINQLGGKNAKKNFINYKNKIKGAEKISSPGMTYGPKYSKGPDGKPRKESRTYSKDIRPIYIEDVDDYGEPVYMLGALELNKQYFGFDAINKKILSAANKKTDSDYEAELKQIDTDNGNVQTPHVKFSIYGKSAAKSIILPGTISGISEDFAPEWNSFKYIGSPFNLYRYGGVERTLKFDVKMYYLDDITKQSMINNLNRLRKLVFPDEDIGVSTYPSQPGGTDKSTSQLFFTPNLVYLTINGLYENILGVIDSLSFSIDDNVSWATTTPDYFNGTNEKPYPTVINVSLGMKIIEHPTISKDNKFVYGDSTEANNQYVNYFTGLKQ